MFLKQIMLGFILNHLFIRPTKPNRDYAINKTRHFRDTHDVLVGLLLLFGDIISQPGPSNILHRVNSTTLSNVEHLQDSVSVYTEATNSPGSNTRSTSSPSSKPSLQCFYQNV